MSHTCFGTALAPARSRHRSICDVTNVVPGAETRPREAAEFVVLRRAWTGREPRRLGCVRGGEIKGARASVVQGAAPVPVGEATELASVPFRAGRRTPVPSKQRPSLLLARVACG